MRLTYRVFLAIDALALLVALAFFVIGLGDGSVSSFNIALWLMLLGGMGAIVIGGAVLNTNGHRGAALGVLAILAAPALLGGLLVLAAIVLQPRWN